MIKHKIKALGFIEVLIAIVVVGIVSAVFLSIAGNAMKDLVLSERIEYMARVAKDAKNIAQDVANQEKAEIVITNDIFPNDESRDVGRCFFPQRESSGGEGDTVYKFAKNIDGENFAFFQDPVNPNSSDREVLVAKVKEESLEWVIENDEINWNRDYFVLMCIENIDTTSRWTHVRFWVGDLSVKGEFTNDRDVKDFIYYAVIEL
jgi:type II secretory pathway pseudopilin PulG